jgi:polar amino acid transport system substrate-binding protein
VYDPTCVCHFERRSDVPGNREHRVQPKPDRGDAIGKRRAESSSWEASDGRAESLHLSASASFGSRQILGKPLGTHYIETMNPPRRPSVGGQTVGALLIALTAAVGTVSAAAQAAPAPPDRTLIIATKDAPPFSFKRPDGSWTGISIELWRGIANELGYQYELRETDLASLVDGIEDGRFDASVAALTITPDREARIDFTHAFHASGLAIAVRKRDRSGWLAVARLLFSPTFFRVVVTLTGLLLVVAFLVWLFERRANPEQFGGKTAHGIGASFWYSAVTMTTVGYGDKTPRSIGGRIVALVWMFTAIIVISSFTASITASLTVGSLEGAIQGPDDLPDARLGSVPGSTSSSYLDRRQLPYTVYDTPDAALAALAGNEIDAVVYDAPILRYAVRQRFGPILEVLPAVFEHQYYGIALPEGSPLLEPINEALLRRTSTPEWNALLQRYLGN